jgi:outer membrane lipoprotein
MKNYKLLTCLFCCIFAGCSLAPQNLRVDENTPLTTFSQVKDDASSVQGASARWGGVIAKVTNNADNTMLEVVHFSLNSSSRPKQADKTLGRFKVYYKGLLDPLIYKQGRSITVLGQVSLLEDGVIGEHKYQYPVLNASAIHLWKNIEKVDVRLRQDPFWYSPSYWYYPRSRYPRAIVIKSPSNKPVKK